MNTIGHCPRFLTYRNIEKKELQNWKRITERRYYFPSASNNLSASMLRIKKKGAFQKRLSFKYSQSLKSETRLITVAKYCIHWHFPSNTFLLHQPFTPQKKDMNKKKVFKTWAQSAHRLLMCGWMLLLICLQLLSKTKSRSCDPVGRRHWERRSLKRLGQQWDQRSGLSAAGGCVNSGVRSRLALIIHTGT